MKSHMGPEADSNELMVVVEISENPCAL